MTIAIALSPLLVVGFGALLLMMAEAFAPRQRGLALGAAAVLFTGASFAVATWLYGWSDWTRGRSRRG